MNLAISGLVMMAIIVISYLATYRVLKDRDSSLIIFKIIQVVLFVTMVISSIYLFWEWIKVA